jgi:hypothetical protein
MAPIGLAFAVLDSLDGSTTELGLVLAARHPDGGLHSLRRRDRGPASAALVIVATLPVFAVREVRELRRT